MARKTATLAQTTGIGYEFEDYVAAFLLTCFLKNEPPFSTELGGLTRLEFNERVRGWLLDDLVVTFQNGSHLALSIKSNDQISANRLPTSFVEDTWEQYLQDATNPFDAHKDYLGLISAPLETEVKNELSKMQDMADVMEDARFITEVESTGSGNAVKRSLLNSLQCPASLNPQQTVTKEETVKLLRRLQFRQFDFLQQPSEDEKRAISNCRDLLRSGDSEEAKSLWGQMVNIVKKYRINGGYIDLPRLLNELEFKFELKPWPQYNQDFKAIEGRTSQELQSIPDQIGQSVRISRESETERIQQKADAHNNFALIGESGCGKSVLTRKWVETRLNQYPVLWIQGRDLAHQSFNDIEAGFRLAHSLEELAGAITAEYAYCVIDGVENAVGEAALKTLGAIIRTLKIGEENSRWRLVLTCQSEEWFRISPDIAKFTGLSYPIENLVVSLPMHEEYEEVYQKFPQVRALALQEDLNVLMRRPKIIDVVVMGLLSGNAINPVDWLGEASIANWHWRTQVMTGPNRSARGKAMMCIAEIQADIMLPDIGLSDSPDRTDELLDSSLLIERGNRISFQHDLYGDWTRLQILTEHQNDFVAFVNRKLTSPFWNRAVRLYGLHLLETDRTGGRWFDVLNAFSTQDSGADAQDIMLEALFHVSNPKPLLDAVWHRLIAEEGNLLKRMLGRFLHSTTFPDEAILALSASEIQKVRYAGKYRLPYWMFWQPMLLFLYEHKDEILQLTPELIAEIANIWLDYARRYPGRKLAGTKEAADFAVTLAEDMLVLEWDYSRNTDKISPQAFTGALMSYDQFPERVRDFVLRASGRIKRKKREPRFIAQPQEHSATLSIPRTLGYYRRRIENVKAWPDGPIQSSNSDFEKICLEEHALTPLVFSAPELAAETLLALLIETPVEYEEEDESDMRLLGRECQIKDHAGHYPPFWWHSSWLVFLRIKPEIAIDAILKLVNFATERRVATLQKEDRATAFITFFEDQKTYTWAGDAHVYVWYRAIWGPHAVSSVLMSLEHWLYELLEQGQPVTEFLIRIRDGSSSLALAGLLAAVASKRLELLQGPLKFLLSSWELLLLDVHRYTQDSSSLTPMIAWTGHHQSEIKIAHEWHSLPHRKQMFQEVSQHMFLFDQKMHPYFAEVCERWKNAEAEMRTTGRTYDAESLAFRISVYDLQNYRLVQSEDGQQGIQHYAPQSISDHIETERQKSHFSFLQMEFPTRCCQILDGEKTLKTEEDVEAFWIQAQQILANYRQDDGSLHRKQDIETGVASVLLIKHRDWLKSDKSKEDWCKQQIIDAIRNPPAAHGFDSPQSGAGWEWERFCADAMPILWCEDLASEDLRVCILMLCLDKHDQTIRILSRRCHKLRKELGASYLQLMALLRLRAIEEPHLFIRENLARGGYWLSSDQRMSMIEILSLPEEEINRYLSQEFVESIEAFVEGTLPPIVPSFLNVQPLPRPPKDNSQNRSRKRRRHRYNIDVSTLQTIYSFLKEQPLPTDKTERQEYIELWKEILACFLETLQPADEEEEELELDHAFYEADRWILEAVASFILQMKSEEKPETLWQPLFDLGWTAHHYIEHFLLWFFLHHLDKVKDTTIRQRFLKVWSEMFAYAAQSHGWNKKPSNRDMSDLWQKLTGLSWYGNLPWDEEHQLVIKEMSPMYKSFCAERLEDPDTAGKYLRFLSCAGAKLIRLESLLWVEPILKDWFFEYRHSSVEDALATLAVTCWSEHEKELRGSQEKFDCYKRLVRKLVSRQNGVAMALQAKIIGT
jgi:hypothetical protein